MLGQFACKKVFKKRYWKLRYNESWKLMFENWKIIETKWTQQKLWNSWWRLVQHESQVNELFCDGKGLVNLGAAGFFDKKRDSKQWISTIFISTSAVSLFTKLIQYRNWDWLSFQVTFIWENINRKYDNKYSFSRVFVPWMIVITRYS